MCLQWCHVTRQLLDNDLPCEHCPDSVRFAHIERSCGECLYREVGITQPRYGFATADAPPVVFCGLTRMLLPPTHTCCHWNAELTPADAVLTLTDADVARGLLRRYRLTTVAELFAESDTAPESAQAAGGVVVVPLADLSVPEIYGVPAYEWRNPALTH